MTSLQYRGGSFLSLRSANTAEELQGCADVPVLHCITVFGHPRVPKVNLNNGGFE